MPLDPLDHTPLPQQLAALIRGQIQTGELGERDLLPSEAQMQSRHSVSRGTVREAMRILRDEGWVVTVHARGTYVAPAEQWPAEDEKPVDE